MCYRRYRPWPLNDVCWAWFNAHACFRYRSDGQPRALFWSPTPPLRAPSSSLPRLVLANDPAASASSRLVLLSLLDATLPVLHSVIAPHAIENLCVEPRSGRIFATRSSASSTAAAAAAGGPAVGAPGTGVGAGGTAAALTATAGVAWGAPSMSVPMGRPGSGEFDVAGVAASSGDSWVAAAAEGGTVSVLALASGSFLDRGPLRSAFREVQVSGRVGSLEGSRGAVEIVSANCSRGTKRSFLSFFF